MNEFGVGINEAGEHIILQHPKAHELLGNYVVAKRDVEERIAALEAMVDRLAKKYCDGCKGRDYSGKHRENCIVAEARKLLKATK